MFDFDVVTGPANPIPSAKPGAPPAVKPLTPPPPTAAAAALRDDGRGAKRPALDPAGTRS
jgi:hypothetical protein